MGRQVTNRYDKKTVLDHMTLDLDTGCWNWTGSIQSMGYGQIEVCGRLWLAHRFSWFMYTGQPPSALMLHKCDNRRCVNPDHLFIGTHMDNHLDAVAKGRVDPMLLSTHSHKRRINKLTDVQVRAIRTKQMTGAEYAKKFGVARSTVYDIMNGKTKLLVK